MRSTSRAAGIAKDRKGPLFRTTHGRSSELTGNPLLQPRRVADDSPASAGSGDQDRDRLPYLPRLGITAYLKNGGKLEIAQQMAAHESARTTGLYDRRNDEILAR